MSNFIETRGALARLLATENLVVQHNHEATTASFNVKDRVLTLPILKTESEFVYNMMTGHEVGHALYTPADWHDRVPENVPFDFVNVIEDVRIEKNIQAKFPGLRRDFTKGYDQLNDDDFFGIADKDLSKLSFIDRINLHFKLGARALVPFTDEEMTYVKAVDEADTFDKVCLVSSMLRDYLNAKRDEGETTEVPVQGQGSTGGDQGDSQQSKGQSQDGDDDSEELGEEGQMDQVTSGTHCDELTSETQNQFDDNMEDMARPNYATSELVYVSTPEINLDDVIIPVSTLRESFMPGMEFHMDRCRDNYNTFLTSIKRDVNFMVQQFEMKKSADAYARQQTHKTGVLNTEVLHNYKLADDIFLRQTITPDGKNHGMILLVDWSGSMSVNLTAVVKQIITLVQFCRKVQIPFEVYTFTSGRRDNENDEPNFPDGQVSVRDLSVIQVISSTSKSRETDIDMFNLFSQAYYLSTSVQASHSYFLDMGGTPLNNAMFLIPEMVKRMRQLTNAQKVSFCVLTDGESSPLYYWKVRTYKDSDGETDSYCRASYSYYAQVILRDGYRTHDLGFSQQRNDTGKIASYLQETIEDFSLFNIYISPQKGCGRYLENNGANFDEKVFRKENAFVAHTDGWPMICCVAPKAFGEAQQQMDVDMGESKAKIKSALKKFLASKQSSKTLLSRIVESFA